MDCTYNQCILLHNSGQNKYFLWLLRGMCPYECLSIFCCLYCCVCVSLKLYGISSLYYISWNIIFVSENGTSVCKHYSRDAFRAWALSVERLEVTLSTSSTIVTSAIYMFISTCDKWLMASSFAEERRFSTLSECSIHISSIFLSVRRLAPEASNRVGDP